MTPNKARANFASMVIEIHSIIISRAKINGQRLGMYNCIPRTAATGRAMVCPIETAALIGRVPVMLSPVIHATVSAVLLIQPVAMVLALVIHKVALTPIPLVGVKAMVIDCVRLIMAVLLIVNVLLKKFVLLNVVVGRLTLGPSTGGNSGNSIGSVSQVGKIGGGTLIGGRLGGDGLPMLG